MILPLHSHADLIVPTQGVYTRVSDVHVNDIETLTPSVYYKTTFDLEIWNSQSDPISINWSDYNTCVFSLSTEENVSNYAVFNTTTVEPTPLCELNVKALSPILSGVTNTTTFSTEITLTHAAKHGNFTFPVADGQVRIVPEINPEFQTLFGTNYGATWVFNSSSTPSNYLTMDPIPVDYGELNDTTHPLHIRLISTNYTTSGIWTNAVAVIDVSLHGDILNAGPAFDVSTPNSCGVFLFMVHSTEFGSELSNTVEEIIVCSQTPVVHNFPTGRMPVSIIGKIVLRYPGDAQYLDRGNITGTFNIDLNVHDTEETAYTASLTFDHGNLTMKQYEDNTIDWNAFKEVGFGIPGQHSSTITSEHITLPVMIMFPSVLVLTILQRRRYD